MNPKWSLCLKGRKQSPIDIRPELLLYDPLLPALELHNRKASGHLINTGRGLLFRLQSDIANDVSGSASVSSAGSSGSSGSGGSSSGALSGNSLDSLRFPMSESTSTSLSGSVGSSAHDVQFQGGPLTYAYTLSRMHLHYGRDERRGSEHSIAGQQLPGELQLLAFNSQLYANWHDAQSRAHGLIAVSALIQLDDSGKHVQNKQLLRIVHALKNITSKGNLRRSSCLTCT
jgi:hypothetical protein